MNPLPRLAPLALALLPLAASAARPWQEITVPSVAEAAAAFPKPPPEYGAIHWFILGGPQSKERMVADLDALKANGVTVCMLDNSGGMQPKYFTPEYLDFIKFTIDQAKQRGIKVWIEGDAGYPDGFAGGLISRDYPQLGMQAIVDDAQYAVAAGQTLRVPVPPDTLGVLGYNRTTGATVVIPLPADGQLRWTAPDPGSSEVVFVRHVYRSSPTRYTNRADGTRDKDSLYSEIDYLDPKATQTYLHLIFDEYQKLVGPDFGSTVLGFRGDETDYTGFMPWTPQLLETFQEVKGYDLRPYLAQFFAPTFTPEVRRAKADYWDVWSAMFRDNFYRLLGAWCQDRGMEYMVHLNHEETMLDLRRGEDLIRNEGSFFRDMRYVQVPGIDNLNQLQPGLVADFPKLASDTAHLFGRAQVWEEEGGSPGQAGKFVADYNFVRGVNYLNIRGLNTPWDRQASPLLNPAAAMAGYVNRASYLLAVGRPAAQVALVHPDDSMWLGDEDSNRTVVRLTTELMERQIDFDAVDSESLADVCTLEGGGLRNLSGQVYRAVIVGSSTVIEQRVLDRLRAFAAAGGKVIFAGRTPTEVIGRTFLHPEGAPDLSFATLREPSPHITDAVVAALPAPDVKLNAACPGLKYIHRALADGDVYFFFNESYDRQERAAVLAGRGQVQEWDPTDGTMRPVAGVVTADGHAAVPLVLESHESRFLVIGPWAGASATAQTSLAGARALAELGEGWSLALGDRRIAATDLKPWESLGAGAFTGVAHYRKEFTLTAPPAGGRVYLDLGRVREIAGARLNGAAFAARPWPPYVWDVTDALRPGANVLEVDVQLSPREVRRFGGGGAGRRGAAGAAPGPARSASADSAPTGVPGGLPRVEAGFGGARSPFTADAAQPAPASGLLGPVRLLAQ